MELRELFYAAPGSEGNEFVVRFQMNMTRKRKPESRERGDWAPCNAPKRARILHFDYLSMETSEFLDGVRRPGENRLK
jgi:hypothetical protein